MKYNIIKPLFLDIFIIILCISCVSKPKINKYSNYTYEQIIKKHGIPKYDYIIDFFQYEIDNEFELYKMQSDYNNYDKEKLENGISVRELIWEKKFNQKLIIWLKYINGQWIVVGAFEYNNKDVMNINIRPHGI